MGVPAFFSWLMEKYPQIATKLSTDNKFICDYLYLDMNGIIHPCCHPEGKLKPRNEQQMIEFMCEYISMLLQYIEPTQLLFVAIDGPPPRAKMMQQRERRFIKEYESNMNEINNDNNDNNDTNQWDSNQITPGTSFMVKVSNGLRKYIHDTLTNATNKQFKIILSDASVPGEGEHKILDFIRNVRHVQHNASQKHVLFSNDADMIFLSLLLHETNVYLMRDIPVVKAKRARQTLFQTKFNIINFKMLSKYLQIDLSNQKLNYTHFAYDMDRVIDDFVFLSYFVGNDFIPCLPFINMRDGAFEYILQKYIQIAKDLPCYLVNGANINYNALSVYFNILAKEENDILMYRMHCFLERIDPNSSYKRYSKTQNKKRRNEQSNHSNEWNAPAHKKRRLNNSSISENKNNNNINNNKLEINELNNNCKSDLNFIQFGSKGYKPRYYQRKFKHELNRNNNNNNHLNEFVNNIKMEYIRALSWIQYYYYSGVMSWKWYFPFHFAPLISDIAQITNLSTLNNKILWKDYEKGEPLTPLTQLALVMPKTSAERVLPESYYDTCNKLKKYYPDSFEMDLNFKQLNWESIAMINHVNVELLQQILTERQNELSETYKKQNMFGYDELYVQLEGKTFVTDKLHTLWNCEVIQNLNELNKDSKVIKYDINIPATFDIAQTYRKCEEIKTEELKEINEKNLEIVSQTMCKFFMSGKNTPRNIVKYMKKRPTLWGKSVKNLRKSIMFSRKSTVAHNKKMKLQMIANKKKKEKNKDKKSNNDFISKLKSIGMRQQMNATNASQVIIDSVLSAIRKNKNSEGNNNNNNITKKKGNEIKMNVKMSKTFKKKNRNNSLTYEGMKKKRKQKMKSDKFKNVIKHGAKNKKKNIEMNIHRESNSNNNSNNRNVQKFEIKSNANSKKKKKTKKKKKKSKKSKKSKKTKLNSNK